MIYMLDTNICSYIIRNRPLEVLAKFKATKADSCCISSITYAELKYWFSRNQWQHEKSKNQGQPKINAQIIDHFVSNLDIVDFDVHAAEIYADVRAWMEGRGLVVGSADLMISSHAISLGLMLVTNTIKDFINIPKIMLENWVS